jgi:hypothetical protein
MLYEPADFVIRQGDTAPRLTGTLTDGNGDPVVVTGSDVLLHLHGLTVENDLILTGAVDEDAVDDNGVYYDWEPEDTEEAGYYSGEWQVTFVNGQIQTFPNDSVFLIQVSEQVA